jgi:putative peptidoglycan lipid II flippase
VNEIPSANRQIARATGTIMAAILFGQLAGLARGILVARIFGASAELDAFLAANRVSETLFLLVAGGALSSAFIPAFTSLLVKKENKSAWRLASSIANLILLVISLLALIAAWFAPQIVRYALAPGFSSNPALFGLTISLLRVQLIAALFFGIGGLIIGVLNSHQIFFIPALTPAAYQLGIIFGAVFLTPSMGVRGLAWGVVIGAFLFLALQIPVLLRLFAEERKKPDYGSLYHYSIGLGNAHVREVIFLMAPRLLGVAVVQLNFWVNTWLASRMAEGSVTGIYYGFSLMLMAQAIIAQSVAMAAMPTFSAQHALGQKDEMRASLAASLRGVIFLAVPASVGLMLLQQPLVALLYQRGEFDERSAQLVAWALLWYAGGLVGHSIMEVLTRAFYAQHDTRTPVIIGICAMLLNLILSITLSRYFEQLGWLPHGGLALANSLATALEAAALFIVMRFRLNGMDGQRILRAGSASTLCSLFMAAGLLAWLHWLPGQLIWLRALGGVILGGFLYLLASWLGGVNEVRVFTSAVIKRIIPGKV